MWSCKGWNRECHYEDYFLKILTTNSSLQRTINAKLLIDNLLSKSQQSNNYIAYNLNKPKLNERDVTLRDARRSNDSIIQI